MRSPARKVVAAAVIIAAAAIACTTSSASSPTETTSSSAPPRDKLGAFTEQYVRKTFDLPADRPEGSRTTNFPPPATLPDDVPIDHVIFVIKENRTFDHYFGTYPGADGATEGKTIEGQTVPLAPAKDVMTQPITHGYWSGIYAIDGGRMDGFNTIVGGEKLDGYAQFDREGIPNYWAYADRYVLTDRFFTSEYGPTFPEHLYTVAASSFGIMDNKAQLEQSPGRYCDDKEGYVAAFPQDLTPQDHEAILGYENAIVDDHPNPLYALYRYLTKVRACLKIPTLPERLTEAGVSWKFYNAEDFPIGDIMRAFKRIRYTNLWNNVVDTNTFFDDITSGNLANVSWVNPPGAYNEHPILPNRVQSVCAGENWTVHMMNLLQNSPYWRSTAVVVIWDDFGGFYDHVPPPQYDIMGLGPRTPGLIMSPWTVKGDGPEGGAIDSHDYEFSSVLAFIEQIWGIDPLTERDAAADPLTGAFDFSSEPDMRKLILPLRQDCPYGTEPPLLPDENRTSEAPDQ